MTENLYDQHALYKELLYTCFEKVKKHLQKKYKEIAQLISQYTGFSSILKSVNILDQIKEDRELNANKYYGIFKLCIETRDTKLVETSIYYLYKLVSHGFIDGNTQDFVYDLNLEENRKPGESERPPAERKLIDSIVENVCSCKNEKNENIQLQIIKVLVTLVMSIVCEVHGKSLQEIVSNLTKATKNPVNQATARAALTQISNVIFQRMEQYNSGDEDYRNKRQPQSSVTSRLRVPEVKKMIFDPSPTALLTQNASIQPPRLSSPEPNAIVLERYFSSNSNDDAVSIVSAGTTTQYYPEQILSDSVESRPNVGEFETPQERYIYRCVKNLVDDVCLHFGKVETIKTQLKNADETQKKHLNAILKNIPLKAVPFSLDADSPGFKTLIKADIENENNEAAGYFGWCIMCRARANIYCKETRVPVCSVECKIHHQKELSQLKRYRKYEQNIVTNTYFQDAYQIFNYLCKLSGKDPANDGSTTSLRSKTLTLELIVSIMENPGPTFLARDEFRDIVKEHLCDSILKNSVSTDKPVFAYSLGAFVALVNNFRQILKSEIAVFIENIFLKMLESANSSFNHRLLALQVFYKITSKARTMLEFYVNYDCKMNSTNVVEKMVDLLCKIAQGKYLRSEYGALILPQQEPHLKILALESLVNLAKSLVMFTEDYQKKLDENNLKNTSWEAEREGEDFETVIGDEMRENFGLEKGDTIEKQRMMKNEIQKAINKFNFKTKLGMKYFEKLEVLRLDDPKSIAHFFFNTPKLSKEKLGEYFGEEHEINVKALTEYTELISFKGLPIDESLRTYLQHFYLPGESQKIDRVMQAFATKYFKDNSKSFNSANAAYTLSYLLIMLQTDAHNPQIKKEERMKLDQFIKLARGINEGTDLPPEELTGFYNRIQEKPLAVREEAKKVNGEPQDQSLKKKEEQFKLESAKMIEKGKEMIKQKKDDSYDQVMNTDYVRPFFSEILWSPILAAFGAVLERYDDPKIVQLCLEGLTNCVVLTGLLRMDTERDTFLLGLIKFTNLKPVREIKEKNAKCIKLLLQLATSYGRYFRSSWKYVLENISKVDYYLHYSPHSQNQGDVYVNEPVRSFRSESAETLDHINSETIKNIIDPNSINRIFSKSSEFNLEEILDFITCLCRMSEEELKSSHGPNIFGLQKLVEVAHFNMNRIKFIWSQIWNIMREHISKVAINSNQDIAFFAVDSLKQLSIKFLMKDEFASSLEFQKEFLKPFETIYQNVQSDDIKELVLNCCNYIIAHVMKNIKSGWKIIVDILILAANSNKETLVRLSFQIAEKIIKENIEALREVYGDMTILLLTLAKFKNEEMSLACLKYLKTLTGSMIQQHEAGQGQKYGPQNYLSYNDLDEEGNGERVVLVYGIEEEIWLNMLIALVSVCNNSRRRVHMQSVITLFEILRTYGDGFSKNTWQDIMTEVIKPLFENIEKNFQNKKFSRNEDWLVYNEASREAFTRMIDIYNLYYGKISHLLEYFLNILGSCIQSPHEQLAQITISALRYIINRCNVHFKENEWNLVLNTFGNVCKKTIPKQLLNYSLTEPTFNESDNSLVQCVVQLMMIALIRDVIETYGHRFTNQQIIHVSKILYESYQFAKKFNEQIYLRFVLWKKGPLNNTDQLPALLKQEKESISTYILLIFNLYNRGKASEESAPLSQNNYLNEFIDLGISLIKSFCRKNEDYLNITKQEKVGEGADNSPTQSKDQPLSLEEDFRRQSTKLTIYELEREIVNIKIVITSVFLSNLARIDPKEMKERLREIVASLVNMSFYYIPKATGLNEQGQAASAQIKDESGSLIKSLLMKFYDFSFSNGSI